MDADLFATQLGEKLSQGDIVDGLLWVVSREDGRYGTATRSGLLISHSCDVDGGGYVTFAVCQKYDAAMPNAGNIKAQYIYEQYFLPEHGSRPALVADLSQVQSVRIDHIHAGLANRTFKRVDTLSNLGHWHLLSKLTVHFLRPQPQDEVRYPSIPAVGDRMRYAVSAIPGLARYVIIGRSQ